MLLVREAQVSGGRGFIVVPEWAAQQMTESKVFVLRETTYTPAVRGDKQANTL